MVHEPEHLSTSTTPTREDEHHSRQGVQVLVRQIRMEALTENQCSLGPLLTDLFASCLSTQLTTFVSWRPGLLAIAADAFTLDWHSLPQKLYANPPWNLIGRVLSYIILQEMEEVILVAPVWKAQPWYLLLLHRLVKISLLIHHSPEVIQPTCHNPLPDIIPPTSRVGYLRERCRGSQLSETATNLVLSSWKKKSSKPYDSCFRRWASWCSDWDRDPFGGSVSDVANFLADLCQEGYQYRSFNSYCSSISSAHEYVDGYLIGQHSTIARLMKGAFNERPPRPRHSSTWDVKLQRTSVIWEITAPFP